MQARRSFIGALGASLMLGGCVMGGGLHGERHGNPFPENPAERGFDIDMNSRLVLYNHYSFWPSLSGYDLPSGDYKPWKEDAGGIYFRSVAGVQVLSPGGGYPTSGGIYLPKRGSSEPAFVFLQQPILGEVERFLPPQFFEGSGSLWRIVRR